MCALPVVKRLVKDVVEYLDGNLPDQFVLYRQQVGSVGELRKMAFGVFIGPTFFLVFVVDVFYGDADFELVQRHYLTWFGGNGYHRETRNPAGKFNIWLFAVEYQAGFRADFVLQFFREIECQSRWGIAGDVLKVLHKKRIDIGINRDALKTVTPTEQQQAQEQQNIWANGHGSKC